MNEKLPKLKGKTRCCKVKAEWTYKDKKLVSNVAFMVCTKCKQGTYPNFEDIKELNK